MSFSQRLEERILQCGNPICFGMDPVLERMPVEGTPEERIRRFYLDILGEMDRRGTLPAAVKPNSAYYECISVEALGVLQELIATCHGLGILVVLDAKRGDIGKSSAAYATAAFDVYGADCVTVSPYMGSDSVGPFLKHSQDHGIFSLLRTSNPGAKDLQDQLRQDGTPFWQAVAEKLIAWDNGSVGAVVGATNLQEMERIAAFFVQRDHEIPFLIPGVGVPGVAGQQGGEASEVIRALQAGGSHRPFHLMNSSSGLSFAYEAKPHLDYAAAAAEALMELVESCR
jgi:orotidine-5'-phosphate decarboxylase